MELVPSRCAMGQNRVKNRHGVWEEEEKKKVSGRKWGGGPDWRMAHEKPRVRLQRDLAEAVNRRNVTVPKYIPIDCVQLSVALRSLLCTEFGVLAHSLHTTPVTPTHVSLTYSDRHVQAFPTLLPCASYHATRVGTGIPMAVVHKAG